MKELTYAMVLPVSAGLFLFFRYRVAQTGTRLRSAASITLRSPQMPWAFLAVHVLAFGWWFAHQEVPLIRPWGPILFQPANVIYSSLAFLPAACAACGLYYSVRFGAARVFSAVWLVWCLLIPQLNLLDALRALVLGGGCAFSADMIRNWDLKRRHIMVPGFPRKR